MIVIQYLNYLFYLSVQLWPKFLLVFLSAHMPFWQDSFAPATWFEPMPSIPAQGTPHFHNSKYSYDNRSNPIPVNLGLIVLQHHAEVTGTITLIETRPPNATWDHETFRIKPDDASILNRFNYQFLNGDIEVESPIGTLQIHLHVGDRIKVWGDYVLQTAWGYPEIHMCEAWKGL